MQQLFNETATPLIKEQVRKLIGKHGFTTSDREDLEQELALEILAELGKRTTAPDNPGAFIRRLIERRATTLVLRRETDGRDHRRTGSLHTEAEDCDGLPVELGETLLDTHHDSRLATSTRPESEHVELADDLDAVIAKMPADLKDICERLKHHSVVEVARQLGMCRASIFTAIRRVRAIFSEAGLEPH